MSKDSLPEIHVAAGILTEPERGVLIAQRPAGKHMAGSWEFPGGKINDGETPLQALVRELHEELAVEVRYARYLLTCEHRYPDRHVYLYVWKVLGWCGVPHGAESQSLQWLQPSGLMAAGLLPADRGIVAALHKSSAVNTLAWESLVGSIAGS